MVTAISPDVVVSHLRPALSGRNPKAREQALNVITYAFLASPSAFPPTFSHAALVAHVAPLAADTDTRVAGAAMDCLAALRQAGGAAAVREGISRSSLDCAAADDLASRAEAAPLPQIGPGGALEGTYSRAPSRGADAVGSVVSAMQALAGLGAASPPRPAPGAAADAPGELQWGAGAGESGNWGARPGRMGLSSPPERAVGSPMTRPGAALGPQGSPITGTPRAGRRAGPGMPMLSPRVPSPTKEVPSENAR